MKLIIDIPEEEYNHIKRTNEYSIAHTGYIYDGIPLEQIRAEIEQITDTMGVSYNQYVSKIDVLQIIDKYR